MTLFNKKRHYSDVMAFFIENTEGVLINNVSSNLINNSELEFRATVVLLYNISRRLSFHFLFRLLNSCTDT